MSGVILTEYKLLVFGVLRDCKVHLATLSVKKQTNKQTNKQTKTKS